MFMYYLFIHLLLIYLSYILLYYHNISITCNEPRGPNNAPNTCMNQPILTSSQSNARLQHDASAVLQALMRCNVQVRTQRASKGVR